MDTGTNPQGRGLTGSPEGGGSLLLGIIGGLVGALIGAVPYLLVRQLTGFFVGGLGFVTGWASACGYRLLRGRRSFRAAMVVVAVCSLAALVLADFAANMLSLCNSPDWQASAKQLGIPVSRLAFESLLAPANRGAILPNLLMCLLVGLIGVFWAGRYVRKYTDPEWFEEITAEERQEATAGVLIQDDFDLSGMELPLEFTVRAPKRTVVTGIVLFAMITILMALCVAAGILAEIGAGVALLVILYLVLAGLTAVLILQGKNRRLEVEGELLRAYDLLGRQRQFLARDIVSMGVSNVNGYAKLYAWDGQVLFKFNRIMNNEPLLMKYLSEHNIPLRG